MIVYFHAVDIAIDAGSEKDAYAALCDALAQINGAGGLVEWETRTYSTDDDQNERPTSDLFPEAP